MSVVMDDSLTSLKSECDIVKSLYYRNKNQHGASYLFQMLHKVVRYHTYPSLYMMNNRRGMTL